MPIHNASALQNEIDVFPQFFSVPILFIFLGVRMKGCNFFRRELSVAGHLSPISQQIVHLTVRSTPIRM